MSREKPNYRLLARYLANECTEQEREIIERWVARNNENHFAMQKMKHIWDASTGQQEMQKEWMDIEKDWHTLQNKIGRFDERQSAVYTKGSYSSDRASKPGAFQQFMKVAAIFVVMALVSVFAYTNWYEAEPIAQESVLKEISTANGQRVNLTLSDGTGILVNSGSDIKFPDTFQPDKREVFLEGEAYFNVTENSEAPFLVHTKGMTTKVLGTSFSVRSYSEDVNVRVVVEEGKVALSSEAGESADPVILSKNELGQFDMENGNISTRGVEDLELYLSWTDGILKFKDQPMRKVANDLERRYDIEVILSESIANMQLTANLKSRSMNNVLDVIAMSLDVNYRVEKNDKVYFEKK